MKLVVLFISILVLSMSSLPCCLLGEIGENSLCIESRTNTEDGHSRDQACSPFFNCGSCSGFAIQENMEITFLEDELSLAILPSYKDLFKSAYQTPEFKPPKFLII